MNAHYRAVKIVDLMYFNDPFSLWLGIERVLDAPGKSVLRMIVRHDMLNGFAIAHGGITFSLADSALAFASNGYGNRAVSIETSITHLKKAEEGDVITATAVELSLTSRFGVYQVNVANQHGDQIALFKGTVYRTEQPWVID